MSSTENPARGWWPTSLLWAEELPKQQQEKQEEVEPHHNDPVSHTPSQKGDEETGSTSRADDMSGSMDGFDHNTESFINSNSERSNRKTMESAKSYHSRVSNMARDRTMAKSKSSGVSVSSSTRSRDSFNSRASSRTSRRSRVSDQSSQRSRNSTLSRRSRRSDMMRRQKNMSHLIKATKGESMPLFHSANSIAEDKVVEGHGLGDDVESKGASSKERKEGQFYGWGTSSQSDFSESVAASEKQPEDDIELYVSFPNQDEECEASVTDSAGSKPLEEVVMPDEVDPRRPWRKAPPVEHISCESASSLQEGGSEFSVSITVEEKSRKTKYSNQTNGSGKENKTNSKEIINPKIGIVITTNNDNTSCGEKSNEDIKSGSDVSELLEAKAALRQSQLSLAGVNRNVKRSSTTGLSISELSLSGTAPIYRKPEPFRPGPAFEKKFAQSNRMMSLGSIGAYPSNMSLISLKSANTFLTKSIAEEDDTYNDNSPSNRPNEISTDDQNQNTGGSVSNKEGSSQLLQEVAQTQSQSTLTLDSGTKSSGSSSNSEMLRMAMSKEEVQERQLQHKRSRRLSLLDKVDEFELEDDWDAVSAMSNAQSAKQNSATNLSFTAVDVGDNQTEGHNNMLDFLPGDSDEDHQGGMNRTEERNKMLELQELYGSESDIGSLTENSHTTPRRKPTTGTLRTSVSNVSSAVQRGTSQLRRRYHRYRSGVHLAILVSLIFVLAGTLLLVLLTGKSPETVAPTMSPIVNVPLPSPVFQPMQPTIPLPDHMGEETPGASSPTESPISFPTAIKPHEYNNTGEQNVVSNRTSQSPTPSITTSPTEMGDKMGNITNTTFLNPSSSPITNTTNTTNTNFYPSSSPIIVSFNNSTYLNNTQQPLATNNTNSTPSLSPTSIPLNQTDGLNKTQLVVANTSSPTLFPSTIAPSSSENESGNKSSTNENKGDKSSSPTLSPDGNILASKRQGNPNDTPSPTVFTMWPTPLDTYSMRFSHIERDSGEEYDNNQ